MWRPLFFHDDCVEHDRNYRSGMKQEDADNEFLSSMLTRAKSDPNRRSEAGVFFAAVAKYGHKFHPGENNE